MNKIFKNIALAALLVMGAGAVTSCNSDLDVTPIDPSLQSDVTPEQSFNKCYSLYATSGNDGGDSNVDVSDKDGGFQHYFRQLWNSNELTTDEAICGWGDEGIPSYCYNTYDGSHPMLDGFYYRLCITVTVCNQYLEAFGDYDATMTAEVRFLRAFAFYSLMDAFGNIPFTLTISGDNPPQYSRAQVYEFIEGELLSLIGEGEDNTNILSDPAPKKYGDTGYGRVDKAAAWMLLMRLYLNAEVYTGTAQWAKARDYAKKVIDSPYRLLTQGSAKEVNGEVREFTPYQMLFMGDNGVTDAAYEAIFPVIQDGVRTTSYGGANFLIASTFDSDMHPNPYEPLAVNGLIENNTWGGNRARPELVRKFFPNDDAPSGEAYEVAAFAGDDRALFCTEGRSLNIEDVSNFKFGYAVAKFTNFKTDGSAAKDVKFPDMHLFYMRKAEAYLAYAEALTRLSGGSVAPAEAVEAINVIRGRAHTTTKASYSLNDILDEWSREFYFEGRRRIDLIRFGKFGGTTDYKWQYKGGAYEGRDFEAYRNIFAIPNGDLVANSNLQQNPGYAR